MENFDISWLCNIIILVGAIVVAIKNIYKFVKEPVDKISNRTKTREEEHIESVIQDKVPTLLQEYDEKVRAERSADIKEMVGIMNQSFSELLDDKIEDLKSITLDQGHEIKKIQESIKLLNDAQLDQMRYNMNRLYYKYRPYKKILDCDKKAFMKFYSDYKPMGGNSWIDSLNEEVSTWEIVETEEELKKLTK